MEIAPVHTLDLDGVLSESKRIFRANYRHFLALSFFFLPLSFSLIINPTLSLSGNFFTSDHFPTITYSTYHGFSDGYNIFTEGLNPSLLSSYTKEGKPLIRGILQGKEITINQ
ncbi:hypothetical protein L1887_15419 [Cichorium endivia]|nr:hypothetical protein L1887_15419 [Cichorium endivia]